MRLLEPPTTVELARSGDPAGPQPTRDRLVYDTPAIHEHELADVIFNEYGELFDNRGILPESFPYPRLYAQRNPDRFRRKHERALACSDTYGGAFLWITDRLSDNYYHWLCECLPRLEVFVEHHGRARLLLPRSVFDRPFVHASLAAWPSVELVEPPPVGVSARAETLLVPGHTGTETGQHPRLIRQVARRIVARFVAAFAAAPAVWAINVSRARARRRRLRNESVVRTALEKRGFRIFYAEEAPMADQVAAFARATAIAGPHGAGLANMMFMRPGGSVIEFRLRDGSPDAFPVLARIFGHRYIPLYCQPADLTHPHAADLLVDLEDLEAVLDTVALQQPR